MLELVSCIYYTVRLNHYFSLQKYYGYTEITRYITSLQGKVILLRNALLIKVTMHYILLVAEK